MGPVTQPHPDDAERPEPLDATEPDPQPEPTSGTTAADSAPADQGPTGSRREAGTLLAEPEPASTRTVVYGPVTDTPDEIAAEAEAPRRGLTPLPVGEPLGSSAASTLSTIERLQDGPPRDGLRSWIVTAAITLFALGLRLYHLDFPRKLIFDETYYPKDAYGLLNYGFEHDFVPTANQQIADGDLTGLFAQGPCPRANAVDNICSAYVVHPPLGKWLIASGEHLFGMNSWGWRVPSAVFGALMILLVIRLARRLGRSTLVGAIAGILLCFDGLQFVMSRTGLLDIFQATFLVGAVAAIAADRDWFRHKLADHLVAHDLPDLDGAYGPKLWFRPWRLAAGLMFGCSVAVKWNSIYAVAAIGLLTVCWDVSARRLAGARAKSWWALLGDGIPAFLAIVGLGALAYTASWIGWFRTDAGWDRQWAVNPDNAESMYAKLPNWLGSWFAYHREVYRFHTGDFINNATHTYEANPAGWLIMARPIGIDAQNGINPGEQGCQAVNDTCLRVISGLGTPILWWLALAALVAGLIYWIAGRDWRFGLPIVAALAMYLPWFQYTERPLFFFYAVCIIPFTVTALALCLGQLLGAANGPQRRRNSWIVSGVVGLVALNFAFFWPIYTDQLMTRRQWQLRMWFGSWI